MYYQIQEHRIATGNQTIALTKSEEPHATIAFFVGQMTTLENQVKSVLDRYSDSKELGRWARSIIGIGPVIASGLMAHIDITMCPTAGHLWRFAGLDPTQHWLGKAGGRQALDTILETRTLEEAIPAAAIVIGTRSETLLKNATSQRSPTGVVTPRKLTETTLADAMARRPWNASLKTLCWKIGESFVKVCNNPDAFYGRIYAERKEYEKQRNASGALAEQAAAALAKKKIGKDTEAFKAYSTGILPPAHIHARAKRYAVKLFLAHYWQRGREFAGLPVPLPYPVAHLGHAHVIEPPG